MYFCIFEKASNSSIWFYVRTLAYIDLHCGIELYKLKQKITHIEELFEEYKQDNINYEYKLDVESYDPGDVNLLDRKDMEVR